jgi:serine/threonine protein kinase
MRSELDLVNQTISSWRGGGDPDAAGFIESHPQLAACKSLVLDLALEEYSLRQRAGEVVSRTIFCGRFGSYRDTVARLLEVHDFLAQNPGFAPEPESIEWPLVGDEYQGFELKSELGCGAFSRVFLASEPVLGNRSVVVKVAWTGDSEARTQGKLSHPNVVPVHSTRFDCATGLTLVCMPFLGRATLNDLLVSMRLENRTPSDNRVVHQIAKCEGLEPPDSQATKKQSYTDCVLDFAVQLADALSYVHRRDILHCDIKPSNILLDVSGRPMFLDFNLSVDSSVVNARFGGTLPYMAPEQLRAALGDGSREMIDGRTDLFALGAVLYELLTLKHPFDTFDRVPEQSDDIQQLLARRSARPPLIQQVNPTVDPSFASLIERCLEVAPEKRPQSAKDLASELHKLQSTRHQCRRWIRTHQRSIVMSSGLSAVVLGLAVAWYSNLPTYEAQELEAGLVAYANQRYGEALNNFSHAAAGDKSNYKALFARGLTNTRLKKFRAAEADFQSAMEVSARPEIRAMLAFCSFFDTSHRVAKSYAEQAVSAGFNNAANFSNLGYANFQLDHLAEAIEALNKAIQIDPALPTAHRIRALVLLQLARLQGQSVAEAVAEIEMLQPQSSNDAELCFDAACIYAVSAKTNRQHQDTAISLLWRSLQLGAKFGSVLGDELFGSLRGEPRFEDLKSVTPPGKSTRGPLVVIPVTNPDIF